MEEKLKEILTWAMNVNGGQISTPIFFADVEQALQEYVCDRRYKMKVLAASDHSATLKFQGKRFYYLYDFSKKEFTCFELKEGAYTNY